MKRVTYGWKERLDTALGSLFPFFLIGAMGFLLIAPHLFWVYLIAGISVFVIFYLTCPWLPGRTGLTKVILLEFILGLIWLSFALSDTLRLSALDSGWIIAMVLLPIYGIEMGGLASHMKSDLDPFLARLGVGTFGNLSFAGSVRTGLLNGSLLLKYFRDRCVGCRSCIELCPQAVWVLDEEKRARLDHLEKCTACRACLVQCQGHAIRAEPAE
jgi:NAD-dependent dihydropyrimidine dehydrogenase PreA subunit